MWVQIPSGTPIFFRVDVISTVKIPYNSNFRGLFLYQARNVHKTNELARKFVRFLRNVKELVHAKRAYFEVWMHAGSLESTREVYELLEAQPRATLAS